jgi:hypothetical protein
LRHHCRQATPPPPARVLAPPSAPPTPPSPSLCSPLSLQQIDDRGATRTHCTVALAVASCGRPLPPGSIIGIKNSALRASSEMLRCFVAKVSARLHTAPPARPLSKPHMTHYPTAAPPAPLPCQNSIGGPTEQTRTNNGSGLKFTLLLF